MKISVISILLFCAVTACGAAHDEEVEILKRVRRVIGGSEIGEGTWPWLVHLKGKVANKWMFWGTIPISYKNYYCTGSVINKRWVLTAAHCFHAAGAPSGIKSPKNWHATVGEVDKDHTAADRLWGWFTRDKIYYKHVSKIEIYPSYNTVDDWKHDIAVLQLESDLPLDSDPNMQAVVLPTSDTTSWPQEGQVCVMQGWGCTTEGGKLSSVARAVKLPILPESQCSWRYGTISSTRMCAGADAKNIGICQGDSGGPLVCLDNDKWCQAGLASFTSASQPSQVPGVFTRISHYVNWIKSKVGQLGN